MDVRKDIWFRSHISWRVSTLDFDITSKSVTETPTGLKEDICHTIGSFCLFLATLYCMVFLRMLAYSILALKICYTFYNLILAFIFLR